MIVDGRTIAEEMLSEMGGKLEGKKVCFVSLSGEPASESYIAVKSRVAERLGIEIVMASEVPKSGFDGVVVQLPLPAGIDTEAVLNSAPPESDIDLLGREAKERYKSGETERVPPVVGAVQKIFDEYNVELEGKSIVVLGKGRLVGEPVAMLFDRLRLPYSALDKLTPEEELFARIREADILVSGIGSPHFLKPEMLKRGVVLIDAGTSESEGRLAGDADPACESVASLMTPVPGGVGPITVAVLFRNLVLEY